MDIDQPVTGGPSENIVLELSRVARQSSEDSFSLQVRHGEVVSLLGPRGSGKTAILRMAIGLDPISGGSIAYCGRIVDNGTKESFVPLVSETWGWCFNRMPSGPRWPLLATSPIP
jgi:ABC-type lipoprotein export system ATPase subunit